MAIFVLDCSIIEEIAVSVSVLVRVLRRLRAMLTPVAATEQL